MKSTVILYDELIVGRQGGFVFDAWYENQYLAAALASGLVLGGRYYGSPVRGTYLAVFEARDLAGAQRLARELVASHPAVERTERFVGEQIFELVASWASPQAIESRVCYPVFFRVPAESEAAFNDWYDQEHVPMLLECPHWPMGRRFRIRSEWTQGWTHVALHYLTSLAAFESRERDAARSTPWRARLEREDWFRPDNRVYFRHGVIRTP